MESYKIKNAVQFIVLMGFVSLFGDIVYEGARSVTGPYLALFGVSAATVGFISGLGEFIGYGLRLVSGYFADRTKQYWLTTFIGYSLIAAIPLLAYVGFWQGAAVLIILERMGKGIRSPARDALLSHATKQVGRGWGFGLHEAMDQIGAIIGPLLFSLVFLLKGNYAKGFSILWVPVILTLSALVFAMIKFPRPEKFEIESVNPVKETENKLPKVFWLYCSFIFLSVAGFANFQLISFHFKTQSVISDIQIPVFYAIAMGVDGIAALAIGKIYDKIGLKSLLAIPLFTFPIPFFAFTGNFTFAVCSMVLWGTVMGMHETIMRAAIADLTHFRGRGSSYGIFNTVYGAAFFIGSFAMGLLYDVSPGLIIFFAIILQTLSIPVFFKIQACK